MRQPHDASGPHEPDAGGVGDLPARTLGTRGVVDEINRRTHVPPVQVGQVLGALADVLRECAADGTRVHLTGVLSMERVHRAARTVRNPRTGEPLEVPAQHGVRLTPGSTLKSAARGAR
ncbi:HU family DNA-binding protein [Arsenicicoccus dermatophilus]|uniref:HU family DNA-binding protein n=1 Tax=Arsenicicoccus dermatophilus TaxID=1076331 RepID=UPI003916ECB5